MPYDPKPIRAAYDAIAASEEEFEKGFSLRNEIPRELIKRYLKPGDVVLDAGGGAGVNAVLMARLGAQVTLLDLSPELLKLAAENIRAAGLSERIELLEGDITDLSRFADGQFSLVTCLGGALSYVREQGKQAVVELVRVAKQGAVLIIGADSKTGFVRWLLSRASAENLDDAAEIFETSQYEAGEGAFAHLYTPTELAGLLAETGCEVLEMASTPVLVEGWEQNDFPAEKRENLLALELKACGLPELHGAGHHLICVARKR